MSNEVIKEAEENAEKQDSVEQQTNTENSSDTKAEETNTAVKAQTDENINNEGQTDEDQSSESEASGEMDFGAILEQFEQEHISFHSGQMVKGKVVEISDRGVLIDFGYKSEGIAASEEFTNDAGELTIKEGDEIDVVIKQMGPGDAPPTLSRDDAQKRYSWDKIEEAFNNETPVKGIVKEKTKGGLLVDVEGVEAFLPGSQVDSRPIRNLDSLKGEEIEAQVIKFSRKRNNIVISRKVLTDLVVNKQKKETLDNIGEKHIVEGTVKNLTDYGAFVDIGGIDGLLHVTDMSWGRLQNPNELFKVGDNVQVKILKLDRDREKVSLGYKQLIPDPWTTVTELYPVNSTIKGVISSVTEYGAFVELEPGVEGLVHISEMSWSKRLKHPKHLVRKGEEVEVQVLGIDPDERRISLGIKQLQENPWDTIGDRYFIGSKVHGKVRNLTDFGAFVEVEEGVDGLVHISDISWSKNIKHPKEVLSKGQEVDAIITSIDTNDRRLSLSIKELTPSSWESFTNDHKPGDVVKGKISRFAGFGVFVELAPDLEGLCHISELSDERIENPEDKFEIGQELDFKILRIEHDAEKIGLSHRAIGESTKTSTESTSGGGKSYSGQAKGGMASLGELANLKFGKKTEESADEAKAETTEEKAEEIKSEVVESEETTAEETSENEATTAETGSEASDKSESTEAEETAEAKTESVEEDNTEEKADETAEAKDESVDAKEESVEAKDETVEETAETSDESKSEDKNITAASEKAKAEEKVEESTAANEETKAEAELVSETENSTEADKETENSADEATTSETENTEVNTKEDEVKAEPEEVKQEKTKEKTKEKKAKS